MQAPQEAHIDDNELFVVRLNKQSGDTYTAFSYLYHQLILVIHPTGVRIIEGQTAAFSSMDLVLLPPGCHCCWKAAFTDESTIIHLLFENSFSSEPLFAKTAFRPVRNLLTEKSEAYTFPESTCKKVVRKLFSISGSKGIVSYFQFFSLLDTLAHSEFQRHSAYSGACPPTFAP